MAIRAAGGQNSPWRHEKNPVLRPYLAGPSAAAAAMGVAWVTGFSSEPSFEAAAPLGILLFCLSQTEDQEANT